MAQGTVKQYETESRTGVLLLDDRSEVLIDPASMEGSGLRYLRLGQRVKFEIVEEGGGKIARSLRMITL
jgi:2-phospho-L-lactate guanylyltransferase